MPESRKLLDTGIENPGHNLKPLLVEIGEDSAIEIVPYHHLPGGTHKMVSVAGMFQRIPEGTEELLESTTGNAGYAAAYYAKQVEMPIKLFMPEGMAPPKIQMLEALGADIIETPRAEYTGGARKRAQEYYDAAQQKRWLFNQATNLGNWQAHEEVAYHLSGIEHLVLIGGTCGIIAGLTRGIKKQSQNAIVTEIDLDVAPHFLNKKHGKPNKWGDHGIVGAAPSKMSDIGEKSFDLMDRSAVVSANESELLFEEAVRCGLDAGKSSIVNLAVAARMAKKFRASIGTATCDHIDRYEGAKDIDTLEFSPNKLVKFFESEIVKFFKIHLEDLHDNVTYKI
jgi:cysteine synthase